MSGLFRVAGESLDVDALLSELGMKAHRVWRRGEPRFQRKPEGTVNPSSGASFVASDAGMNEFEVQVQDATRFLNQNAADIEKLVGFPGVEDAGLDFGIELRDVAIHSDDLPPLLLQAAGALGISVELSHYRCMADERVKHIQVIDAAENSVYDVFAATGEEFALIFPEGHDVAFIEEVMARGSKEKVDEVLSCIWKRRMAKRDAMGIHGLLFYGLGHKAQYYPTRRDEEAINRDGTALR
jgi:hypothetical protein